MALRAGAAAGRPLALALALARPLARRGAARGLSTAGGPPREEVDAQSFITIARPREVGFDSSAQVYGSREEAENADLITRMSAMELESVEMEPFASQETVDLSRLISDRFRGFTDPSAPKRMLRSSLFDAFESNNVREALLAELSPDQVDLILRFAARPTREPMERRPTTSSANTFPV